MASASHCSSIRAGASFRAWVPTDIASLRAWWDASDTATLQLEGSSLRQ
ncbi:hypothetical protein [Falsirhodobacter deserti]|nr:hypothetical protein [Falsirhodobacter deserti]